MICAAGFPFLMVHDCMRLIAFGRRLPHIALAADGVWTLCVAIPLAFSVITNHVLSAETAAVAWVGGAAAGALVAMRLTRVPIAAMFGRVTAIGSTRLRLGLATDFGVMSVAGQTAPYVAGLTAGVAALGGLRAAQLSFGPILLCVTASRLVVFPVSPGQCGREALFRFVGCSSMPSR